MEVQAKAETLFVVVSGREKMKLSRALILAASATFVSGLGCDRWATAACNTELRAAVNSLYKTSALYLLTACVAWAR